MVVVVVREWNPGLVRRAQKRFLKAFQVAGAAGAWFGLQGGSGQSKHSRRGLEGGVVPGGVGP